MTKIITALPFRDPNDGVDKILAAKLSPCPVAVPPFWNLADVILAITVDLTNEESRLKRMTAELE